MIQKMQINCGNSPKSELICVPLQVISSSAGLNFIKLIKLNQK